MIINCETTIIILYKIAVVKLFQWRTTGGGRALEKTSNEHLATKWTKVHLFQYQWRKVATPRHVLVNCLKDVKI